MIVSIFVISGAHKIIPITSPNLILSLTLQSTDFERFRARERGYIRPYRTESVPRSCITTHSIRRKRVILNRYSLPHHSDVDLSRLGFHNLAYLLKCFFELFGISETLPSTTSCLSS